MLTPDTKYSSSLFYFVIKLLQYSAQYEKNKKSKNKFYKFEFIVQIPKRICKECYIKKVKENQRKSKLVTRGIILNIHFVIVEISFVIYNNTISLVQTYLAE